MASSNHAEERKSDLGARSVLLRAVLWAAGGLVVLAAVLYGIFWLPFRSPGRPEPRLQKVLSLPARPMPPAAEEATQPGYEWADREAGLVRIPVEEAMKVLVERLPVREGAAEAREEKARKVIPTDAGSGRSVRPARSR